jgi:hypothetical protein
VCPWNVRFARELPNDSPYAARDVLAGKDARALARELLVMTRPSTTRIYSCASTPRGRSRGSRSQSSRTPR